MKLTVATSVSLPGLPASACGAPDF
jgi:hypothetical protein